MKSEPGVMNSDAWAEVYKTLNRLPFSNLFASNTIAPTYDIFADQINGLAIDTVYSPVNNSVPSLTFNSNGLTFPEDGLLRQLVCILPTQGAGSPQGTLVFENVQLYSGSNLGPIKYYSGTIPGLGNTVRRASVSFSFFDKPFFIRAGDQMTFQVTNLSASVTVQDMSCFATYYALE